MVRNGLLQQFQNVRDAAFVKAEIVAASKFPEKFSGNGPAPGFQMKLSEVVDQAGKTSTPENTFKAD